jgi:hypothetical protein
MRHLELLKERLLELSDDIKFLANDIYDTPTHKILEELEDFEFKLDNYYKGLDMVTRKDY